MNSLVSIIQFVCVSMYYVKFKKTESVNKYGKSTKTTAMPPPPSVPQESMVKV